MGKALLQFTLFFSSDAWANPVRYSRRNQSEPVHRAFLSAVCNRLRQLMGFFQFQVWSPIIQIALLVAIIGIFFPMRSSASQLILAWNDKNQTVDGYRVFKRTEGQAFDYANPAWPTDGRDHDQTSCTISNLTDGTKYYFVVRAYAGHHQSSDSNEVGYKAPGPSAITIVNDNHPPTAEAGTNQYVHAGDRVVLDGSGSSDPDGDRLSYAWIQKEGPAADLSGSSSFQCSFTAPAPTAESSTMIFELKVTDANGESSADTCIVLIHAVDQGLEDDGNLTDDHPANNSHPGQPVLKGIADGENDISLTPLLRTSEFADPNLDDYHALTEWRILLTSGNQQVVFDRTCDKGQLTEIRVPPLVLEPSTEYSAQVRFFDDRGMPSPWSQPVVFTTLPDSNDQNHNNVPDSQEIIAAMDMNGDTISDLQQEFLVKTLATYNEQHRICVSVELNDPTVEVQAAASFGPESLTSSDETALYSADEMPYGLLGYRIKVEDPGEIIAVKFYLSDPLDPRKIRWARHDAVDGLTSCDASTDMDDNGLLVNRYLVDGGDEDADGVANGVIVDLSGPIEAEAIDHTDDSSPVISNDGPAAPGGSSGGCFILSLD